MDAREALVDYASEKCKSRNRYAHASRAFFALFRVLNTIDQWSHGDGNCTAVKTSYGKNGVEYLSSPCVGCTLGTAADDIHHEILTALTGEGK